MTLRGSREALAPLRAHEARSDVFPGNLANLFIVSRVMLEETPGGASGDSLVALVARAAGGKCERCWTWSEAVGRLSHPGVCERCHQVLGTLS